MSKGRRSPLFDKVALVTGASRGIGRGIALRLGSAGAVVGLVGRSTGSLRTVEEAILAAGGSAGILEADLSKPDQLAGLPERVHDSLGPLHILIHAAGIYRPGPLTASDDEVSDDLWQVNVRAPLMLSLACMPMLRDTRGEIVLVNSSIVRSNGGGLAAYSASKRALSAVADSLRADVNESGVRVLSVYPGRTATPMQEDILAREGRPYEPERLLQPEDIAEVVLHSLSLPRTAEVTDIHIRPFLKS